jgi:hypothetical protein
MASCVDCDAIIPHQWQYHCRACSLSPPMGSCPICWEQDEIAKSTLACGHSFHTACLSTWLARNPTCPLCRRVIAAESQERNPAEVAERARLAAAGLEIPPYLAGLQFRNEKWHFGNQRSTYEVLDRCKRGLGRDQAWLEQTYATVYHHPARYGTFADNQAWSPTYTSQQLHSLCDLLVRQE